MHSSQLPEQQSKILLPINNFNEPASQIDKLAKIEGEKERERKQKREKQFRQITDANYTVSQARVCLAATEINKLNGQEKNHSKAKQ